jgi:hypothetical protein
MQPPKSPPPDSRIANRRRFQNCEEIIIAARRSSANLLANLTKE